MIKRALVAVAGSLAFCFSLSAQQIDRPDIFSALNKSFHFASLTLSDGQRFSFSEAVAVPLLLDALETPPPDVPLPALIVTRPRTAAAVSAAPVEDSSKEVLEMRRPYFDYAGGEVGFLYGRSTGKFASDFEQGYIVGEVGNEHLHISAGASYERSSGRVPRLGR